MLPAAARQRARAEHPGHTVVPRAQASRAPRAALVARALGKTVIGWPVVMTRRMRITSSRTGGRGLRRRGGRGVSGFWNLSLAWSSWFGWNDVVRPVTEDNMIKDR